MRTLEKREAGSILRRSVCDNTCPGRYQCPLFPLAVAQEGKGNKNKKPCLLNEGPDELRAAYLRLFTKGSDGVIEMIKAGILEYGKILRESKGEFTPKERLRHVKELNSMLSNLNKMIEKKKPAGDDNPDNDPVKIVTSMREEEPDPESLVNSPVVKEMLPSMKQPEGTAEPVKEEKKSSSPTKEPWVKDNIKAALLNEYRAIQSEVPNE